MSIYREACKLKLRFKVAAGNVTVYDLFDYEEKELAAMGSELFSQIKTVEDPFFGVVKETIQQKTIRLKIEILKDIIEDKLEAKKLKEDFEKIKQENMKTLNFIEEADSLEMREKIAKMTPEERQKLKYQLK